MNTKYLKHSQQCLGNSLKSGGCSLSVSGITSGIIYAITWFEACSQLCSDPLTSHLRPNKQFSSVNSKKEI